MLKNLLQLVGQRTLVTGATGGLGFSIVEAFIEHGQKVTAVGRNQEVLNQLSSIGAEIHNIDLNDSDAIKSFFKSNEAFDNVILCHGIHGARPMRMLSKDFNSKVIQTNLLSVLDILSLLQRAQKINSPGRIIIVTSISAHMGAHTAIPYSASKAGCEAAMRGLARDLLHKNITVNSIAPAAIETPLFEGAAANVLDEKNYPLGIGKPSDVSNAALYLCLNGSKYITGESIILNGGCTWLT